MDLKKIKTKMKKWKDCAGFDLPDTEAIDNIKAEDDVRKILSGHRDWLDDLASDAQQSTNKFEKELLGY